MKLRAYIVALHAALFAILLAVTPAGSGSMTLLGVGKPAGAASCTPNSLSGLIAWFKADTGVTSGGNSTPVTAWADQSGGGNNVGTGGSNPTFLSAGFNGQNAVSFTSNILQSAAFPIGTSNRASVFIVGQMLTGTAAFGRAVSYTKPGGTGDFDNVGSAALLIRDNANNGISAYANSIQQTSSSAFSLATNVRLGMIFDGANVTAYVNGAASGTPSSYSNSFVSAGTLSIGRDLNGSAGWSGAIAEVVVFNADQTANVACLDLYFKNKWGL